MGATLTPVLLNRFSQGSETHIHHTSSGAPSRHRGPCDGLALTITQSPAIQLRPPPPSRRDSRDGDGSSNNGRQRRRHQQQWVAKQTATTIAMPRLCRRQADVCVVNHLCALALCALRAFAYVGVLPCLFCCLLADPVGGTEHQPQPNKYDLRRNFLRGPSGLVPAPSSWRAP